MTIALIEYFPGHGYEAWITDIIEIDSGLGDVFDTRDEALIYAKEHNVPVIDLTHIERPYLEGDNLRNYMGKYLKLSPEDFIESIL